MVKIDASWHIEEMERMLRAEEDCPCHIEAIAINGHESTRWRTATERKLSAFERFGVLGWDEV